MMWMVLAAALAADVPAVEMTLDVRGGRIKEHIVRMGHERATAMVRNCLIDRPVDSTFTLSWQVDKVGNIKELDIEVDAWTDEQRACVDGEIRGRLSMMPSSKRATGTLTGVSRSQLTRCSEGDGVVCTELATGAMALIEACEQGGRQACAMLAERKMAGLPTDFDRAGELAQEGCRLHAPLACDLAPEPTDEAARAKPKTAFVSLAYGSLRELNTDGSRAVGDIEGYGDEVGGLSVYVPGEASKLLICDGHCEDDPASRGAILKLLKRCERHERLVILVAPGTRAATITWVTGLLTGPDFGRLPPPIVMEAP